MDWILVFFGCVVLVQLVLAWIRLGVVKRELTKNELLIVAAGVLVAILPAAVIRLVPVWAQVMTLLPALVYLSWASLQDASYPRHHWRKRMLIGAAPIGVVAISALLTSSEGRALLDHMNYTAAFAAGVAMSIATAAAVLDYRNIKGLEPEGRDDAETDARRISRELLGEGESEETAETRLRLSDTQVWYRVILNAFTIVLVILQTTSLAPLGDVPIPWSSLVPLAASLVFGLLGLRGTRQGQRLRWSSYCWIFASSVSFAAAVGTAARSMSQYSDLSVWPMIYRTVIGVLIAILYAEDAIVSFFVLNRFSVRVADIAYAVFSGATFGAVFVAASTVAYYGDEQFRLGWVLFMGFLLLGGWVCSIIAMRAFTAQVPEPFMTLKAPKDIVLSDQTMFMGLMAGCVTGASLLSNDQNPQVAAIVGIAIVGFVGFCLANDSQHEKNEALRLKADDRWSSRDRGIHIRWLIRHMKIQEALPIAIVVLSFVWTIMSYWA